MPSDPSRRDVLLGSAATLASLAGCVSAPAPDTPTGGRRVSLLSTDDPPDLPVRPEVEVVAPEVTASGPPRLRVMVENVANYPVEVGEEREVVFAYVHSQSVPGVQLLPEPASQYRATADGCWRLAEPVGVAEYYGVVGLDPGEATARELGVWGGPGLDGGCLPTGRFRFLATYSVGRDRTDGIDDLEESGRWGFDLRVESS